MLRILSVTGGILTGVMLLAGCGSVPTRADRYTGTEKKQALALMETVAANQETAADWRTLFFASRTLADTGGSEAEEVFAKLLRRTQPIRLSPDSDLPGLMPPLDELQSMGMAYLRKAKGKKYAPDFQTLCKRARPEGLLRVQAVEHLRALGEPVPASEPANQEKRSAP